jgi:hypothetical protein
MTRYSRPPRRTGCDRSQLTEAASTEPMSTNMPVAPVARCDCHEWHPVADIASWFHRTGPQHLVLVRDWAQSGIWKVSRCRLSHAEMTGLIRAVGGITCDRALDARRLLSGEIELVNGLHR